MSILPGVNMTRKLSFPRPGNILKRRTSQKETVNSDVGGCGQKELTTTNSLNVMVCSSTETLIDRFISSCPAHVRSPVAPVSDRR